MLLQGHRPAVQYVGLTKVNDIGQEIVTSAQGDYYHKWNTPVRYINQLIGEHINYS